MVQRLTLRPKEDRRLLRGHLWAYRNEFAFVPTLEDGELVDVISDGGRFVGRGYYQEKGGIAVRLLSRHEATIDARFIRDRLDRARKLREALFPGDTVYRWVHAESDGFPGLVVDRYDSLVVAQSSVAFYEKQAELFAEEMCSFGGVAGVRFHVSDRTRDFGTVEAPAERNVNGFRVLVDPMSAQKTGLFLDQRLNWAATRPFAAGARVLDAYSYQGLWALHAARYGASRVTGVDSSSSAVDAAREHARMNGLDGVCAFECADVREWLQRDERYDVIILDPPALAKSRGALRNAAGLYQAINRDAMKALVPGGTLITCSCSQPVDTAAFIEVLKRAANAARRQAKIIELRGAAPDHPVLLSMPETSYLKCVILRVE